MLFSCVLAHFWAWKVVPVLILHLFQSIFPPMSYFSCAHMGELLRHWFECYAQWLSQQLESEMMGWNSPWWAVTRARLAIELPEISPVLIVWSKALGTIRNSLLNVAVYVHSLAKKGKAKKKKKKRKILTGSVFSDALVRSTWAINVGGTVSSGETGLGRNSDFHSNFIGNAPEMIPY